MANNAWLEQALDLMEEGLANGKTRRRKVATIQRLGITEKDLNAAAKLRGVRVAQVGDDYVFAPAGYVIRPL